MRCNEHSDWRLPTFGDLCPSPIDWGRMAAYIDGEGSILINTQKRGKSEAIGFYLRITVANTDIRLPQWIKENFGGNYHDSNKTEYYESRNWKRCWHWGCSAHRAAWILHNCLPYLVIKREQAELGLQLQVSLSKFVRAAGRQLPSELLEERKAIKKNLLVLKARGVTLEEAQAKRIQEVS